MAFRQCSFIRGATLAAMLLSSAPVAGTPPQPPPVEGVSLLRPHWLWSCEPLGSQGEARIPVLDEHAGIQWFNPRGVLERDFNPSLTREEGSDNERTVLEMRVLRPFDSTAAFTANVWTGLTQSVSHFGADLSRARFLEVWVNDRTPIHAQTRAKLHIDFGRVSEDAFWQPDSLPNGRLDSEDRNCDTKLDQGEDTGLDGLLDADEPGYDPNTNPDPSGDDYNYDLDHPTDYSKINGTEGSGQGIPNARPETEDLDLNCRLDTVDSYFEATVDLSDTAYVAVDVARDYPGNPVVRPENGWRLFRIPIEAFTSMGALDWSAIKHLRIWLDGMTGPMSLQIGGIHFDPPASWEIPRRVLLRPSHPNPFRESTVVEFELPADGSVRLAVYDVRGRLVRELLNGFQPAGTRRVVWFAKEVQRRYATPSGVYFVRLEAAGRTETRRIVFLR